MPELLHHPNKLSRRDIGPSVKPCHLIHRWTPPARLAGSLSRRPAIAPLTEGSVESEHLLPCLAERERALPKLKAAAVEAPLPRRLSGQLRVQEILSRHSEVVVQAYYRHACIGILRGWRSASTWR